MIWHKSDLKVIQHTVDESFCLMMGRIENHQGGWYGHWYTAVYKQTKETDLMKLKNWHLHGFQAKNINWQQKTSSYFGVYCLRLNMIQEDWFEE